MVRHLAIELDASADQTAKLETIVKGAITDLAPMHEKIMTARVQARALLTGPTVDHAAIEKLRADQIVNSDAVTKRITQAGSADTRNDIMLYGVVEANSHAEAAKAFEGHPHLQIPQSSIEVMEINPMQGM